MGAMPVGCYNEANERYKGGCYNEVAVYFTGGWLNPPTLNHLPFFKEKLWQNDTETRLCQ